MPNAEVVSRSTFFMGVYPGLDEGQIGYMLETFDQFFDARVHASNA
ncbi:MAG TPA: hypothetical protein VFF59_00530 [Anaerolineae bacterium]|nr:hypothetical protein [Anaerolineae bacterium]